MTVRRKGERTRDAILTAALALFRQRGLERTTMRDIATKAKVALGGAYYYFSSKEAIVLAYYDATRTKHAAVARLRMGTARGLEQRVASVLHAHLDVLRKDRKLLVALLQSAVDPSSPASVFGEETHGIRAASISLFDEALGDDVPDPELRALLGHALWALHMGVLLFYVHDTSPRQEKTRRLVDGSTALVVPLIALAPLLGSSTDQLATLLRDVGLMASRAK